MVIQALVDMQNLSDLLSEKPDVADAPNAQPLTVSATQAIGIEFDKVETF